MHPAWLRSNFLRLLKILQIKEGRPYFWGEPSLHEAWIICSPHLYFNLKSFIDQNSLQFIRFQCILPDSGVLLSEFRNFYKLKRRGPNFWGESILQKVWITWSHLLYFNFKSFKYSISSSFIRFQCILPHSGILFSEFWNLYKLKRGVCIPFRGNIPLGGNSLFAACYRDVGRKKLLKTVNLWSHQLVVMFW